MNFIKQTFRHLFQLLCCYKNNSVVRYPDDSHRCYSYYNIDCEIKKNVEHDKTCYL